MKSKSVRRIFETVKFFVFIALIMQTVMPVYANVAAPSQGGSITGEPYGLKDIYITREFLTIDFRPFARTANGERVHKALVEATYEIENKGGEKNLTLAFALGASEADNFKISFDGQQIEKTEPETGTLPPEWKAPQNTPWKNGQKLMYSPSNNMNKAVRFNLTIPPGKHKVTANYESATAEYAALEPIKAWQLAYILAPAKEWAGFGTLDVKVFVPENWEIVTEPALKREGDVLTGNFNEIPADSLAMTIRPPLPSSYETLGQIYNALFIAALFVFPLLILVFAFFYGYKTKLWWLWGIPLSILWGILIFSSGYYAFYGANSAIPEAQFSRYGYGEAFSFLFLLILIAVAFFIGTLLYILAAFLRRKLNKI